jgi:hypothetical protein
MDLAAQQAALLIFSTQVQWRRGSTIGWHGGGCHGFTGVYSSGSLLGVVMPLASHMSCYPSTPASTPHHVTQSMCIPPPPPHCVTRTSRFFNTSHRVMVFRPTEARDFHDWLTACTLPAYHPSVLAPPSCAAPCPHARTPPPLSTPPPPPPHPATPAATTSIAPASTMCGHPLPPPPSSPLCAKQTHGSMPVIPPPFL